MPCERKHIEAIRKAWVMYKNDHHNPVPWKWERTLDNSIDTALAACDESQWRGMDSAPKDGTLLWLAWKDEDGWCRGTGLWESGAWRDLSSCEDCDRYLGSEIPPTHWMPLPAAPEVK